MLKMNSPETGMRRERRRRREVTSTRSFLLRFVWELLEAASDPSGRFPLRDFIGFSVLLAP